MIKPLTLFMLYFSGNIIAFSIIIWHWDRTSSWKPGPAADDLAT